MANIRIEYSDYLRFYFSVENEPLHQLENIIGWEDYGLDSARDSVFHGAVTSVTKQLGFTGKDKEFLELQFEKNETLSVVKMIVSQLIDSEEDVKYVDKDAVYADFYTKEVSDGVLYLNFNSGGIKEKIEAYEDVEFEVERLTTYDNESIASMEANTVQLKGRNLNYQAKLSFPIQFDGSFLNNIIIAPHYTHIRLDLISNEQNRASSQSRFFSQRLEYEDPAISDYETVAPERTAEHMFYDISTDGQFLNTLTSELKINIVIKGDSLYLNSKGNMHLVYHKFAYEESLAQYVFKEEILIYESIGDPNYDDSTLHGTNEPFYRSTEISLKHNESLAFLIKTFPIDRDPADTAIQLPFFHLENGVLEIDAQDRFTPSENIRFHFFHDILSRLIHIVTGNENALKSTALGRIEAGYENDGKLSLIGLISGLQIRDFNVDSEKYVSPKISLKNAISSICNTFNLGVGIETISNKEFVVIEELDYFYRDEVVYRFKDKVQKMVKNVDQSKYYSSLTFGGEKVGVLSKKLGLNEPNIKTEFTSPISNTSNKLTKTSKVRSDEYDMEDLRRKKESINPEDSFSGDDDNWFIDLKRSTETDSVYLYEQVDWSDRLSELPKGINSPETFRSMIFTPMTVFMRFSSVFNSGTYKFSEKYYNFANKSLNQTLEMKFIGDDESYKENDNIQIKRLSPPFFKNEKVKFTHPYSEELNNVIFGKTEVVVGGKVRLVPNIYFKFEFVNDEDGEILKGYFLKYEYEDDPTFEFILSNEDIIKTT